MALPLMGFRPNDHEKATYLLRKITAGDDGKNANPANSDDLLYVKIPTTDLYILVPIGRVDRFRFLTLTQQSSDKEKEKWVLEEISLIDSITRSAKPRHKWVRFCTLRRDMVVRDLRIQKSLDDMLAKIQPTTSSSSAGLKRKHDESGPDGGKRLIIKG